MTKIGITGGAGFIGTNLRSILPHFFPSTKITIFDNLSLNTRQGVVIHSNERLVEGDLRDREMVNQFIAANDIIIHLAADTRVVDSIENPLKNFEVNVMGSLNILEAARKTKPYLIFFSTGGAILGEPKQNPITEEMPPRPIAPYGAAKLAVEGYSSAYQETYGLRILNLRLSNIYGPNSERKKSAIASFITKLKKNQEIPIYGDGQQKRDFLHVSDVSRAVCMAMERQPSGVMQIASGKPTSLNELLDLIGLVTKKTPRVRYMAPLAGEIRNTYCDITLANKLLGYSPQISLEKGLSDTWKWFAQSGNERDQV